MRLRTKLAKSRNSLSGFEDWQIADGDLMNERKKENTGEINAALGSYCEDSQLYKNIHLLCRSLSLTVILFQ